MTKRRAPNRMQDTKKREILGEIARGMYTVREASARYKIATSAIYKWRKEWGFKDEDTPPVKPNGADNAEEQEVITITPMADPPQARFDEQRALYELRISQLEHENKRLAMLVETLTNAIGDFATNAD